MSKCGHLCDLDFDLEVTTWPICLHDIICVLQVFGCLFASVVWINIYLNMAYITRYL